MIDFPASPSIGQTFNSGTGPIYIWDGTAWNLATAQTRTARERNRVINSTAQVSQANGDTAVTINGTYPADQWRLGFAGIAGRAQRFTGTISPNGSGTLVLINASAPKGSLAATDYMLLDQFIEGLNVVDLQWGTFKAAPVVLRFAAACETTGTYGVSISNADNTRSFCGSFFLVGGEAMKVFSFAVPGDTTGTWVKNTGVGLQIRFAYAAGSNFVGVIGWQAGNKLAPPGCSNGAMVADNDLYITDVGLYADPDNTNLPPPFELRSFNDDLRDCQRYWQKSYSYGTLPGTNTGLAGGIMEVGTFGGPTAVIGSVSFKVSMRAPPAMTVYDANGNAGKVTTDSGTSNVTPTAVDNQSDNAFKVFHSGCSRLSFHWVANARM